MYIDAFSVLNRIGWQSLACSINSSVLLFKFRSGQIIDYKVGIIILLLLVYVLYIKEQEQVRVSSESI
jgi:hypothetical protein